MFILYSYITLLQCACVSKGSNPPASEARLGVYDPNLNIFFYLLTTQTHTIPRGALRFAAQISPLLNYEINIYDAALKFVMFCVFDNSRINNNLSLSLNNVKI